MDDKDTPQNGNDALQDRLQELLANLPIEYRDRLAAAFSELNTTDPQLTQVIHFLAAQSLEPA